MRTGQLRVLRVLGAATGLLTRGKIADRLGCSEVYVGKSLGMADPKRRAAFEETPDGGGKPGEPCHSLLTLGYAVQHELDIDGVLERSYEITPAGRQALQQAEASGETTSE